MDFFPAENRDWDRKYNRIQETLNNIVIDLIYCETKYYYYRKV